MSFDFNTAISRLETFKTLSRALPAWAREQGGIAGVGFIVEVAPHCDGLGIGLKFPASVPADRQEELSQSLIARLAEEERLVSLTLLTDEMRNVGVSKEVLDPLATEAEHLARRLHPEGAPTLHAD